MKRLFALLLAAALLFCLSACGEKKVELQPLKVGIAAGDMVPRDVFDNMTSRLEGKGYKLEYVEYATAREAEDALAAGKIDFSCISEKDSFAEYDSEKPEVLLNLGGAYYYPCGIYLCNFENLTDVQDGAEIAIPSDAKNMARALLLLEANGFITLKEGAGLNATLDDVVEGKRVFKFAAKSDAELIAAYKNYTSDVVVMPSPTAVNAGYSVHKTAAAIEQKDSPAAVQYSKLLLIRRDRISDEKIASVKTLFFSPLMYDLIDDYDNDLIVPSFNVSGNSAG